MNVVLIHGMFCGTDCWRLVDGLLQEQGISTRRVSLHPDGVSKRGRGVVAVTASVQAQLQDPVDQPAVFIGHSLGSLIIEKLLDTFPLAVPVLVNPSPGWGSFGSIYPLWLAAHRGLFWKNIIDLNKDECRKLLFQGLTYEELESAMEIVQPESGELVRQAFWFFDMFGAATRLSRNSVRTVSVVSGALDPVASPVYCKKLVAQYADGSNLAILKGAGHMSIVQRQAAQSLVRRVAAILASHSVSKLQE